MKLVHLLSLIASLSLHAAVDPIADSTEGNIEYPFRFFTPPEAAPTNKLPLILFLHGLGERGLSNNNDNRAQVLSHIQPLLNKTQEGEYPAFVVAPQARFNWGDSGPKLVTLVQTLAGQYPIDPARIYVTGLSDGGNGTWRALTSGAETFAAGVPLSAVAFIDGAGPIGTAGTPVWAFHGDADSIVGVGSTRNMVRIMKENSGQPRYTERAGWGHSSWSNIYADNAGWTGTYADGDPGETTLRLYDWLFAQSLNAAPILPTSLQSGESLLIDFGNPDTTTGTDSDDKHWNNASGQSTATSNSSLSGLVSSAGRRTITSLAISQPFVGFNSDGVVNDTFHPETAQRDSFYAGSFTDHAAGLANPGAVTLSGLPRNATCRVSLFASRSGMDGTRDRLTRYTIGDSFRDLEATDNSDQLAIFYPVTSDENGTLTITVAVSPAGTARFCYLNSLEIEPRPSLSESSAPSDELIYQFQTKRGWPYQIWSSTNLSQWTPLGETLIGSGSPMNTPVIPVTENQKFIRVQEGP